MDDRMKARILDELVGAGLVDEQTVAEVERSIEEDGPDDVDAMQRAEMRAETFAAEALMGMRPGTTEGWYDEPPMGDDLDG